MRILEFSDTQHFIRIDQLTRQQLLGCRELADLTTLKLELYLAEFCGFPGLVKGVGMFAHGIKVFSSDLKRFTQVCPSRVSGNKIKFGYGSEMILEDRADCYEFAVKRERIQVITRYTESPGEILPFELTRPDETRCPCCFDDLSGNVMDCDNRHQICLPCFNLLSGVGGQKKCPCCNTQTYSTQRIERYNRMMARRIKEKPFFLVDMEGGSSFKQFLYNEALFLGVIKFNIKNANCLGVFQSMLLSSLYNYYFTREDDAFRSYDFTFLNNKGGNRRGYSPYDDELPEVVCEYINDIDSPTIIEDVSYTAFVMNQYDDTEFHSELRELEGNIERISNYPNQKILTLKREIYFRYRVKHSTPQHFKLMFQDIFKAIIEKSNYQRCVFDNQEIEQGVSV